MNKAKHALAQNELNKLSEKVKLIYIYIYKKGLTKGFIIFLNILNGGKYFG